jgi:predicted nuclease with TOPRIM domain
MVTTNKDIVREMALLEQRIDSMEDKLDKMDKKLDMITEKLLDPDDGVIARVNKNTSTRKVLVKAIWVIYAAIIGLIAKMFLG